MDVPETSGGKRSSPIDKQRYSKRPRRHILKNDVVLVENVIAEDSNGSEVDFIPEMSDHDTGTDISDAASDISVPVSRSAATPPFSKYFRILVKRPKRTTGHFFYFKDTKYFLFFL